MQDRYTGDVGDFGKYGLLRYLSGLRNTDTEPQMQLGVVWYRPDPATVTNDSPNDGKFIDYLCLGARQCSKREPCSNHERAYRSCDQELYDRLRGIVGRSARRVSAIRKSQILGADVQFCEDCIPGPEGVARGGNRAFDRSDWVVNALRATEGCALVFLDPDNGLRAQSADATGSKSVKHAYLDEIVQWFERGQSVVVYHHLGRIGGKHEAQIADWRDRLQDQLNPADIFVVRFHRSNSRAFFVLAAEAHKDILRQRAEALLSSPWGAGKDPHFTGLF